MAKLLLFSNIPNMNMCVCMQGLLAPTTLNMSPGDSSSSPFGGSSSEGGAGAVARSYRADAAGSAQLRQHPHLKGVDVAHVLWALGVLRWVAMVGCQCCAPQGLQNHAGAAL